MENDTFRQFRFFGDKQGMLFLFGFEGMEMPFELFMFQPCFQQLFDKQVGGSECRQQQAHGKQVGDSSHRYSRVQQQAGPTARQE